MNNSFWKRMEGTKAQQRDMQVSLMAARILAQKRASKK